MKTKFKELESNVIQWGVDRDLYHPEHGATSDSQYLKFITEIGELADAILKQDREKIKDGIGDAIVCLIAKLKLEDIEVEGMIKEEITSLFYDMPNVNLDSSNILGYILSESYFNSFYSICGLLALENFLGFEYLECLEFAYKEIKDRKGRMVNRTFIKDE